MHGQPFSAEFTLPPCSVCVFVVDSQPATPTA
jgi:hypothetical protein